MNIIHLNGRKFFTKETIRQLLLLVANWILLFWGIVATGRYLIGTEPGFLKAVVPLGLLTWVMGYRFKKGFLAPEPAAASLGLAGILVWFLEMAVDNHAGPGVGIFFFLLFLGLFAALCADVWGVLRRV